MAVDPGKFRLCSFLRIVSLATIASLVISRFTFQNAQMNHHTKMRWIPLEIFPRKLSKLWLHSGNLVNFKHLLDKMLEQVLPGWQIAWSQMPLSSLWSS